MLLFSNKIKKYLQFLKHAVALIAIIFLMFLAFNTYGQQAFSYTQYMVNPTPFNSAFSLIDKDTRVDLMLRKQWAGISGAPTTQFVDGFMPIEKTNGAAGIIFENDKIGAESLTQLNGFYAQTVQLGTQHYLALSLNLGIRNYAENYSSLYSTYDPLLKQDIKQTKPNIGFGLLYFSEDFYVGISAPQFTLRFINNTSIIQNNNFRNDYFLTGGITDNMLDGLKLKFATLITFTNGLGATADVSSMFLYRDVFGVGVNYDSHNEAALILSTKFGSFSFGYSYQFGLNTSTNIGGPINGTQELTISYGIEHKRFYVKKDAKVF